MEFKAGLGYMDLCLKNTKPNKHTEGLDHNSGHWCRPSLNFRSTDSKIKCSAAVKRHHDHGDSDKENIETGASLQCQRFKFVSTVRSMVAHKQTQY